MANALLTGLSGLNSHQQMLDVIGNNLANLNTTGFKSQRALFSDLLYETLRGASDGVVGVRGAINPMQVGSGSTVSQIDTDFNQGSLESTGGALDVALDGDGFFVADSGTETVYTRAGAFGVDEDGTLVDPGTGYRILRFGTIGEGTNGFQTSGDPSIHIPFGQTIPGEPTATVDLRGDLSVNSQGPVSEQLQSLSAWTTAGVAASSTTLLNDLDDSSTPYVPGDSIVISGTEVDGSPVSTTLSVDGTTTLGDLVTAIETAFTSASATLGADGRISLDANSPSEAFLSLSLADDPGNTGQVDFVSHGFLVTTDGRDGDLVSSVIEVFDVRGTPRRVSLDLQKQADDSWTLTAGLDSADGTVSDGLVEQIQFNEDGSFGLVGGTGPGDANLTFLFTGASTPQTILLDFGVSGGFGGLTEATTGGPSLAAQQDGGPAGSLVSVQIGSDGVIHGIGDNGRQIDVAQLAVANFRNAEGLSRQGNNYYSATLASGNVDLGTALSGARGGIRSEQLERSNVDIALEFTKLIVAQRGFSANARTITVTDEVLEELTNLIR